MKDKTLILDQKHDENSKSSNIWRLFIRYHKIILYICAMSGFCTPGINIDKWVGYLMGGIVGYVVFHKID